EMLEALDAVVRGRGLGGAVELARDRLVERIDQQGRLAAAGHAGHAGEQAEGDFGGDTLEIVAARVDERERAAGVPRPAVGDRDRPLPPPGFSGEGSGGCGHGAAPAPRRALAPLAARAPAPGRPAV